MEILARFAFLQQKAVVLGCRLFGADQHGSAVAALHPDATVGGDCDGAGPVVRHGHGAHGDAPFAPADYAFKTGFIQGDARWL
jgi:hypothetical protein